jgi:transposase
VVNVLRNDAKQLTFYSGLYEKIPENHLLKKIDKAVDFSFINSLLEDSYCKNLGRPAKEPEMMMMKLLFMQYLYNLSDVRVIEEASFNLVYLWFLGLNPEDKLPDPSLLAKFRTQRMKEVTLDEMITEIVRQCVEKGIIKSDSVSIDTTHIEANSTKKVPKRVMKHLAKRIFKGLEVDLQAVPDTVNTEIPDYTQIEDHKQAKETMKDYLENVIEQAQPFAGTETQKAIDEAKEVLSDEKFILQKGLRSLSDKDARVGNKSKTSQFFGYKSEFTMTTDERIITAASVHSGEYVDGKDFTPLMDQTLAGGIKVNEVYGDKAYFRKDIRDKLEKMKATGYIPISASVYKIDEDLFSYNKDSDQWLFYGQSHGPKKAHNTAGSRQNGRYLFVSFPQGPVRRLSAPE